MFGDPLLRQVFIALLEAPGDDLASLIESVSPELADAIGQLAVLPEPDGDPQRIVGHFLHDAGLRKVADLQREAQRTGDPSLMPVIADLGLLIPEVRAQSFDLAVAEGLVPLLSTRGRP